MRHILLLLACTLTGITHAQHLSVGVLSGPELWTRRPTFEPTRNHNLTLSNGLFVRWDSRRRLSYEAAVHHSTTFTEHWEYYGQIYDFPGAYNILSSSDLSTSVTALVLKSDYRLAKKANDRLQQYAGLQIRPTLWRSSYGEVWYDSATRVPVMSLYNDSKRRFRLWTGLQYTVSYRLRSNLTARAVVSYEANPGELFSSFTPAGGYQDPYGKASLNFGIAYRLY